MNTQKTITRYSEELGFDVVVYQGKRQPGKEVRRHIEDDYLYVELSGLTSYLRRNATGALAIFGSFERHGRNVIYKTLRQSGDEIFDDQELLSEMIDDIDMLIDNDPNLEWM